VTTSRKHRENKKAAEGGFAQLSSPFYFLSDRTSYQIPVTFFSCVHVGELVEEAIGEICRGHQVSLRSHCLKFSSLEVCAHRCFFFFAFSFHSSFNLTNGRSSFAHPVDGQMLHATAAFVPLVFGAVVFCYSWLNLLELLLSLCYFLFCFLCVSLSLPYWPFPPSPSRLPYLSGQSTRQRTCFTGTRSRKTISVFLFAGRVG
jgi:hypothetical protein